ncbi:MAG: hypothetical protein ACXVE4_17050 [Solirubrobacteraceae bacterium]
MSVAVTGGPSAGPRAAVRPLRVVDVTMFYGERSGGIRTYLEAKAAYAARTGRFEHHLVIPGKTTACDGGGRHEHRSLRVAASNGYRLPSVARPCRRRCTPWRPTSSCCTTPSGPPGGPAAPPTNAVPR